jgi:hypothetical protein
VRCSAHLRDHLEEHRRAREVLLLERHDRLRTLVTKMFATRETSLPPGGTRLTRKDYEDLVSSLALVSAGRLSACCSTYAV